MNIHDAQHDMRQAYISGSSGVFVSGIMWVAAAIACTQFSLKTGILTLFFGGMLIHPLSTVIDRMLNHSGKHAADNPLGRLAIESTVVLLLGVLIALAVAQVKPEWFFLIMLLVIGGRYTLFSTLYGLPSYWTLGALLVVTGIAAYYFALPIHYVILTGGMIELIFSWIIYSKHKKTSL